MTSRPVAELQDSMSLIVNCSTFVSLATGTSFDHSSALPTRPMLQSQPTFTRHLYRSCARSGSAQAVRSFATSRLLLSDRPVSKTPTPINPPISTAAAPQKDKLSFFPFLFIFAAGTGLYVLIVRSREGSAPDSVRQKHQAGDLPFKHTKVKREKHQE